MLIKLEHIILKFKLKNLSKTAFLFMLLAFLLSSCKGKKIEISSVPLNTPKGSPVFVCGTFNNWNPADPAYILQYDENSKTYFTYLPWGFGKVEYKFTRGDWTTVETDSCKGELANRTYDLGETDGIINYISGWKDLEPLNCSKVTIVLDEIPINTPKGSRLFIAANVNYWACPDKNFEFKMSSIGKYCLTVPKLSSQLLFKIHRGAMESVEADENNQDNRYREIIFGEKDTVFIKMRNWIDLPLEKTITKVICIDKIPVLTPKNQVIYAAGSFNLWNPLDRFYSFKKVGSKYYLNIQYREGEEQQYKITAGGWDKVETLKNFEEKEDRTINTNENSDTIYIQIENWAHLEKKNGKIIVQTPDILIQQKPLIASQPKEIKAEIKPETNTFFETDAFRKVFIILDKVPDYTEEDDKIFLAGDFNDWNAQNPNYAFRRLPNGKYYIILRLPDSKEHEFKITRGSWEAEEADSRMLKPNNKKISKSLFDDTIHVRITNWADYRPSRKLVVLIQSEPENTPSNAHVYLTGDFNNWQPKDDKFKFRDLGNGTRVLVIQKFNDNFNQYKVTRGDWTNQFSQKRGGILPNQHFSKNLGDTLKIDIKGWVDIRD